MTPEVIQELVDVLWATRELRERGYTMQTAGRLGMADLYATHGVAGLQRYIKIATDNALHNAGLQGVERTGTRNEVN